MSSTWKRIDEEVLVRFLLIQLKEVCVVRLYILTLYIIVYCQIEETLMPEDYRYKKVNLLSL